MIFWIPALIVSFLALMVGRRSGFRKAWPITFNILVSIYFGIMTTGTFGKFYPDLGQYQYIKVLLILGLSAVCFICLHCIIFFLVNPKFIKSIPYMLDEIAGAVLGLVSGFSIFSLVALIIFMFIVDVNSIRKVTETHFGKQACAAVKSSCGFVGGISLQPCEKEGTLEKTLGWLVKDKPKEEESTPIENLADKDIDMDATLEDEIIEDEQG